MGESGEPREVLVLPTTAPLPLPPPDPVGDQVRHVRYLEEQARIRRLAFVQAHQDLHDVGFVLTQARQVLNDLMDKLPKA